MKFSLLLFVLALKLRISALLSQAFRKRLRKRDFVLVICIEGTGRARTFRVRNGRLRSRFGPTSSADTELIWCDERTAIRVMLSKNELDAFSAIGRGQLRIKGNFESAMVFMELAE